MRKYYRKKERQNEFRNAEYSRIKQGLTPCEVSLEELICHSSIELFLHHRFLDEQKAFVREYGIKGYRITPAVYEIIEKSHLKSGKVARRQ